MRGSLINKEENFDMNCNMQVEKVGNVVYADNFYNNVDKQIMNEGMTGNDWKQILGAMKELKYDGGLDERKRRSIQEVEEIADERNEGKLKSFIQRNKDSFITDVLSGLAIAGLNAFLK